MVGREAKVRSTTCTTNGGTREGVEGAGADERTTWSCCATCSSDRRRPTVDFFPTIVLYHVTWDLKKPHTTTNKNNTYHPATTETATK